MYMIVKAKFTQHIDLAKKLLNTPDKDLIELNYWHDNYWGSCTCNKCNNKGLNKLGEILKKVKNELYI